MISSSQNETLTSSDGSTEFIFGKDSGRDLIKNFNFDGDKINVGNETITAVNVNNSGGIRMEISGSAILTLENAQGKNFRINNFVALVDKNLTYNAEANYFVATSQNATLTVGEGAEIWLDGSHGKYFSDDIKTLDASTAEGNTSLVGNDLDNTILAGNGDSSLWGGNLGNDFMQGGTGKNKFFYTVGNDNDTISGANNGDVVNLSQVTLEQIASTNITADAVTLNFKDGGSLQVNDSVGLNRFKDFQLSSGEIANMHFNKANEKKYADMLVNLVRNKIDIGGTVNAIRNGTIDGHLIFVSPSGIALTKSGVINAGRFTGMVPTTSRFNTLWDTKIDNYFAKADSKYEATTRACW